MKTIKLNSVGEEVEMLQRLLNEWGFELDVTGKFDVVTQKAVHEFQYMNKLSVDGIVGNNSWRVLQDEEKKKMSLIRIKEVDYVRAAAALNVEVAAIKAVKEVETGRRGGFFSVGKPAILFEGHVFWKQLQKIGKDPNKLVKGNADILYRKWTKAFYAGGAMPKCLPQTLMTQMKSVKKRKFWQISFVT